MRRLFRCLLAGLMTASLVAAPARLALAGNLDTTADHVLGQTLFTTGTANLGGISASSLHGPGAGAVDGRTGRLFVADTLNSRVLSWPNAAALTNGQAADMVIGQPNFISNTSNTNGLNASGLFLPGEVAVDGAGDLFVADTFNNRVLEYDAPLASHAAAHLVLGQPDFTHNSSDAGGVAAGLDQPTGVTLDAQGNLYVADSNNNRVLRYLLPLDSGDTAPDAVFGQPDLTHHGINYPALGAGSLNYPAGVAVGPHGGLYVADAGNNRVLEYNNALTSNQLADRVFGQADMTHNAGGSIDAQSLNDPLSVALDASGNLYVADRNNARVLEYDAPLATHAVADLVLGQADFIHGNANQGGPISDSGLGLPEGVFLDGAGDVLVADAGDNRVLEYDLPVQHGAPTLSALSPTTVAAGGPAFVLTVSGFGFVSGSVVRWNGSDRPTTFLSGTRLQAAIAAADVVTGGPFAVTVFTPTPGGGTSTLLNVSLYARASQDTTADLVLGQPNFITITINNPTLGGGANQLFSPAGAAVDARTGRLFVADQSNNRVLSWPNAAALANAQAADLIIGQPSFTASAGNYGGLSARTLWIPYDVAVDALGNLFVADAGNNRVLEYNAPLASGMAANTVFGQGGSFTTGTANNGTLSANSLQDPVGVAVDGQGNLYVSDYGNFRALEYDAPLINGTTADHVFGQVDMLHSNHATLNANSLWYPVGLTVDARGRLYVADEFDNRVLEYDSPLTSRTATLVIGQPDFTHSSANYNGVTRTSLYNPADVAVDASGDLFVTDHVNSRVLEYNAPLTITAAADHVFGQLDFTHQDFNHGGLSATSLGSPLGVALDRQGDLFVTDDYDARVLEYDRLLPLLDLFLPFVRR